jgi:hypothetical protein
MREVWWQNRRLMLLFWVSRAEIPLVIDITGLSPVPDLLQRWRRAFSVVVVMLDRVLTERMRTRMKG